MENAATLQKKIQERKILVGIVGIGYVGGSLAEAISNAQIQTLGIDIDPQKVNAINNQNSTFLSATLDPAKLSECDIICICVPTPINELKQPDLKYLQNALAAVSANLKKGQLIVIESSVAVGTTRDVALPILRKSKLKIGEDFYLAFSPERVDPANSKFNVKNTPKVVAGLEENSHHLACQFYRSFVDDVVPVSSVETAEMTKVLENVFRLVNISLINELSAFTDAAGIDMWEVVGAAATKPYGFLAHYPGPGVGGHCIPVLPYYLLDSARQKNIRLPLVETAQIINETQPKKVVEKATKIMNGKLKANGHTPKVLLVGVSYKPETAVLSRSPALKIWKLLEKQGVSVSYHDPYVGNINGNSSQKLTKKVLSSQDLVIITTDHKNIKYAKIIKNDKPVIDTRNILAKYRQTHNN